MVTDHQKVQWGLDLHSGAIIGMNNRLTLGPAISCVGIGAVIII